VVRRLIAITVFVAVSTAVVATISLLPSPIREVPSDRDPVLYKRGRALYKFKCASCHESVAPKLRNPSEERLREVLGKNKPTHHRLGRIDQLIPALREYLRCSSSCPL
jgi:mono/diheme cytochrome c family protein